MKKEGKMIKPEMFQRGKGDREWADANNKGVVIMAQSEKIAVGKFYPNEVEPVSSTYAFSYDNLTCNIVSCNIVYFIERSY